MKSGTQSGQCKHQAQSVVPCRVVR
jgi:hypothetical protein